MRWRAEALKVARNRNPSLWTYISLCDLIMWWRHSKAAAEKMNQEETLSSMLTEQELILIHFPKPADHFLSKEKINAKY